MQVGSRGKTMATSNNPRTAIRDAVLANVSAELDDEQVRGVEWAAVENARAACFAPGPLLDFDEYREVAL